MVAQQVQRYAIYFADLDPVRGRELAKRRPVVVISRAEMNRHSDTVVVCPITSTLHPTWRSRIAIVCAGRQAEVAVDQVRTISKQRLGRRVDTLPTAAAAELRRLIVEMYADG